MTIKKLIPLLLPVMALAVILLAVQPIGISQEKLVGVLITAGLWVLSYGLLRWAEGQNERILLSVLIGGMLFRIVFVLLTIFIVMRFTQLEVTTFVISLLIFYLACEFGLVVDYFIRR